MKRIALACFIPLVVVLIGAAPASAGVIYCKTDPVVLVGGTTLDLSVGIPQEYVKYVNGPVAWQIKTPKGVARQVLVYDLGFNLQGTTVEFTDGGEVAADGTFKVKVKVKVPIDKSKLAADEIVPTQLAAVATHCDGEDCTVIAVVFTEGTSDMTEVDLTAR